MTPPHSAPLVETDLTKNPPGLGRVLNWMKGAQLQTATLELATGGGVPAFRIVAPAGALVLTDAEVVALAQAGQIPAAALQLYQIAHGHGLNAAALGEGPEVGAIHETGKAGAGMSRPPRHHVLPQEHRAWFEERGFEGDLDIDNFTVELERSTHEAVHGGGNRALARQWPGEWNKLVMDTLKKLEQQFGRKLTPEQIMKEVKRLMQRYEINKPFVPFKE